MKGKSSAKCVRLPSAPCLLHLLCPNVKAPAPAAFGGGLAPAAAAATTAGSGLSEGALARREEYMLNSLVRAVETLFFIYYSYQARGRR